MKYFSIIVAFDSQYGIGKGGQLPWVLPADLKHFKEITMAVSDPSKKNALIMGRKTWDSLPPKFRPLPGRINLVLSRTGALDLPVDVLASKTLEEGLLLLSNISNVENIFVIGGAQVYTQSIQDPRCQKLYVTHLKGDFACDAFFPPISRQFIPISSSEEFQSGEMSYHFSEYLKYD